MAYLDQQGSSRAVSVGIVVAVHALIGYAFATGLTPDSIKTLIPEPPITAVNVFKPRPVEPPPAVEDATKPTIAPMTVPLPKVRIPTPNAVESPTPLPPLDPATSVQGPFGSIAFRGAPVPVLKVIPTSPEPVAKRVDPPRVVQGAAIRSFGFGNADYPSEALRAGESGMTRVRVTVSADGRATDCTVTGSSGSYSLDQAGCRLVKSRSRFAPAKDGSGKSVAEAIDLPITWRLPPR